MSGTAERIDDFIASTRALADEAAFVAAFPHPFLVHEATARTTPLAPTSDRRTAKITSKSAAAPIGDGFAREDVWIFRVCPRDHQRDDGDVTLGRDEACDIVVADPTISLVHARFSLEAGIGGGDEGDGRTFFVADAGSSNGTFVDGAPAAKDEPVPLDDQTSLRFGSQAKFQFFTASGFFQFLDFFRRIKKRDT